MSDQLIEEKRKRHREYMRNYYWRDAETKEKIKRRSKEYSSRPEVRARREERRLARLALRRRHRPEVDQLKLAYAAGIIDGEGNIQIRKVAGHNGEKNCRYELVVTVNNIFPKMVQFFADTFGGATLREERPGRPDRWRPVYRWQVAGPTAAWFLSVIKPYLVCKAAQADLAIAFRESFGTHRHCRAGLPQETVRFRHEKYLAMMALHKEVPQCDVLFF